MKADSLEMLRPAPPWTRADLMLVMLLTLAGGVLRIVGLNEGLWIDEIETLLRYARLPAEEIISNYQSRNNHVLYSLTAHYSVAWFGESAWALRLPAALAGIATIPATYYLGRQLASRNEALLAGALLVASYHHVWFSQNARGYTGLLLGAVLLSLCLIRLLSVEKPGFRPVLAYAIIAALTTWIHLTAALVVVAHGIIWLTAISPLAGRQRTGLNWAAPVAMLLAGAFSLALYAPILGTLVSIFLAPSPVPGELLNDAGSVGGPINQIAWKSPGWLLAEISNAALRTVPGGWPAILIGALAMVAGAWGYLKQGVVPAAILTLPPIVTCVAVSATGEVFFPRFLFGSLVFFLLIAVRGGFVLSRTILPVLNPRYVTLIGLAIAVAAGLKVPRAWQPKQDFSATAEFIKAQRGPGDVVVCGPHVSPLRSYLGVDCPNVASASELSVLEQANGRIWFLYSIPIKFQFEHPDLWAKVQNDYSLVTGFSSTVRGGDIVIMMKTTESP